MSGDDRFWQQILDDHRPRPRELRRLDHELAATTPERLRDSTVEGLVAAASAERDRWQRRRSWQHRLSVAAIVLLAGGTGAFMYPRAHGPTTPPSPTVIDLPESVRIAATTTAEARHFTAVSIAEDHCLPGLDAIRDLTTTANAGVANAAMAVLIELRRVHAGEGVAVAEPSQTLADALTQAANADARVETRLEALAMARAHLARAIATLVEAKFSDGTYVKQHAVMVARVGKKLSLTR